MADSPKILFASYHSLLDNASGAAICTRHTLAALKHLSWEAKAIAPHQINKIQRQVFDG